MKFTEFETKYEVKESDYLEFMDKVNKLEIIRSVKVDGYDTFFSSKDDNIFGRYRIATKGDDTEEFTLKRKTDPNNNIIRLETNWDVRGTSKEEIIEGAKIMGLSVGNEVFKECVIFNTLDACIVFYKTSIKNEKPRYFVEFEVNNKSVKTEKEGWQVIKKYEKHFNSDIINEDMRVSLSLYEMYK